MHLLVKGLNRRVLRCEGGGAKNRYSRYREGLQWLGVGGSVLNYPTVPICKEIHRTFRPLCKYMHVGLSGQICEEWRKERNDAKKSIRRATPE